MNTTARLAGFGGALVLLAAGGFAVGNAAGPVSAATSESTGHGDMGGEHAGMTAPVDDLPGGLASSKDGYTFAVADATPEPGRFSFEITRPDGKPVTGFDVEHEKKLHLIVVRRDTAGFRHVHPAMAPDGTWSVPLTLPAAGSYREFAAEVPGAGTYRLFLDFRHGDVVRTAEFTVTTAGTSDGHGH